MSVSSKYERKAFEMIRKGWTDAAIRAQTGYSAAVIQAMRKDIQRIDRHRKDHQ